MSKAMTTVSAYISEQQKNRLVAIKQSCDCFMTDIVEEAIDLYLWLYENQKETRWRVKFDSFKSSASSTFKRGVSKRGVSRGRIELRAQIENKETHEEDEDSIIDGF